MKLTYRISTIIFLTLMLLTAVTDILRMDFVMEQMAHLGYPDFLPLLIGSGKLAGIAILCFPGYFPFREWAYAGFTVLFVSATLSHALVGDPVGNILPPVLMEVLLLVSYTGMVKVLRQKTTGKTSSATN